MIKNIIFDMGNVLLRFEPWKALDYFFDTKEDKEIIDKELFMGPEWLMGDEGKITNEERYDLVKKRVPQRLQKQLKECVTGWDMCISPVRGADEFCRMVKERGYKLYILSNACNRFHTFFPREFNPEYFDGIMVSSDVKMIKPYTPIYEHICNVYGLTPEECLFIDDRKENVDGAVKAGIQAVLFQDNWKQIEEILVKQDEKA